MSSQVEKDAHIIHSVFTSLTKGTYKDERDFLNTCRHKLDPFIYSSLQRRYGTELQTHWDRCEIPKNSDKMIILVERRCHPNLLFCIQNAVYYAQGWGLTIVCSAINKEFIEACVGSKLDSVNIVVQFPDEGTPDQGKEEYNTLLQTAAFWKQFTAEHLLCIETDTYLRKPLPNSVFQYDYIASKWPWKPDAPGGGGLSYRKRSVMETICSIGFPIQPAQDCFVSDIIAELKFSSPSISKTDQYFGEFICTSTMCGTHQWWTGIELMNIAMIGAMLTCD
jgi:hypothetical protein